MHVCLYPHFVMYCILYLSSFTGRFCKASSGFIILAALKSGVALLRQNQRQCQTPHVHICVRMSNVIHTYIHIFAQLSLLTYYVIFTRHPPKLIFCVSCGRVLPKKGQLDWIERFVWAIQFASHTKTNLLCLCKSNLLVSWRQLQLGTNIYLIATLCFVIMYHGIDSPETGVIKFCVSLYVDDVVTQLFVCSTSNGH